MRLSIPLTASFAIFPFSFAQVLSNDPLVGNNSFVGHGYFTQWIDHQNHSIGTFSQKYLWSNQDWKGPGSPVVLYFSTHGPVTDKLQYYYDKDPPPYTFSAIMGQLARNTGAAFLMLEERYFGESSPYDELTTANLQYLTYDQIIHDLANFGSHVQLPFAQNGSTATDVPWVLVAGSEAAFLTVEVARKLPDSYWAYHASSAVVQNIAHLWQTSAMLFQGGIQNCTNDMALVIDHVDKVLQEGTVEEITELKTIFGEEGIRESVDFVGSLTTAVGLYVETQFIRYTNYYYWQFCDSIEGAYDPETGNYTGQVPGAEGVGLDEALRNWGKWQKYVYVPTACASEGEPANSTECLNYDLTNSSFYTDTAVDNPNGRQDSWLDCNEPVYIDYANGAPKGTPTVVSRLLNDTWQTEACPYLFPTGPRGETYGLRTVDEFNKYWGGWDVTGTNRLLLVNGGHDYYRPTTVASELRPGGPQQSTEQVPTFLIPNGKHCSEFFLEFNRNITEVMDVVDQVLKQLQDWVDEWPGYSQNGSGSQ